MHDQTDRMDDQKAQEIHTKMVVQYDNLCQRLRKKLVTQEDVLRGLQDTINFSVQGNPQFKKAAGHLTSPTTVEGFFDILPQHTHYLDFNGILDHLIRDHGDHELKEDAKLYRHEFLDLLGRVTVKQAVEGGLFPIIIDDEDKIPKNFSKVEQHILKDSDKDRLIDIIKYRTRFTSRVQLHHLLFCVMGIEKLDYEYNADFKNTVAASPHNSSEVQQEVYRYLHAKVIEYVQSGLKTYLVLYQNLIKVQSNFTASALINPRRMREGYGGRSVCVCVCLLLH